MGRFAERLAGLYGHKKRAEKENRDTAYEDFLRESQIEDINYKRNVLRPINEESLKNQNIAAEEALKYTQETNPMKIEGMKFENEVKKMSRDELKRKIEEEQKTIQAYIDAGLDPTDEKVAKKKLELGTLYTQLNMVERQTAYRESEEGSKAIDEAIAFSNTAHKREQEKFDLDKESTKSKTEYTESMTESADDKSKKLAASIAKTLADSEDKQKKEDKAEFAKISKMMHDLPAIETVSIETKVKNSWSKELKRGASYTAGELITMYKEAPAEVKRMLDNTAIETNDNVSGFLELVTIYRNITTGDPNGLVTNSHGENFKRSLIEPRAK